MSHILKKTKLTIEIMSYTDGSGLFQIVEQPSGKILVIENWDKEMDYEEDVIPFVIKFIETFLK